jgi:glutamyl-tRNA synthetase
VILRVEDIDVWRNKPGAVEQLLDDLRWLGLDWDGEVVLQSRRLADHAAALDRLKQLELVFPCTCTRADIESAASAPHLEHEGPTYPGTCRHRRAADADALTVPYAWRLRVTDSPAFVDLYAGPKAIDLQMAQGDFVVWRSMGVPAYQLAVVVDDGAAGVTEVIRGDDLLTSTPRQLLLYRALGLSAPAFAHVPLVVGADGRRLAKRHGDTRLSGLRAAGVPAEKLLGLLGWSCGWLDRPEPITARELVPLFRMAAIPSEPFALTPELLRGIGFG